jgi:hypothetical protein
LKEQRYILTGFVALSVLAFVVGAVGECQKAEPNGLDFFVNIVLGVFASAVVAAATAGISYYTTKRRALSDYWLDLEAYIQKVQIWAFHHLEKGLTAKDTATFIRTSETIVPESNEVNLAYLTLAKSKRDISLLCGNSELSKEINDSYRLAGQVNVEVTRVTQIRALNSGKVPFENLLEYEDEEKRILEFQKDDSAFSKLESTANKLRDMLKIKVFIPELPADEETKKS